MLIFKSIRLWHSRVTNNMAATDNVIVQTETTQSFFISFLLSFILFRLQWPCAVLVVFYLNIFFHFVFGGHQGLSPERGKKLSFVLSIF